MKLNRKLFLMLVFSIVARVCWSQSLTLLPTVRNPNTFNPTLITSAGAGPTAITNTAQQIKYNYPSNLPGTGSVDVSVDTGTIPPGVTITITAEQGDLGKIWEGVSTGTQTLSSTPVNLIYGIFTQKQIFRILTLTIAVTDMAQLHPVTTPLTLRYTIHQN